MLEGKKEFSELLFQASGSMKLLKVWMERVGRQTSRTWNDDLDLELTSLKKVVTNADDNLQELMVIDFQSGSMRSFHEKMASLMIQIHTKDMKTIQFICNSILNQIDYIVNDIDKKRKRLYEKE